jgi:hypothetical protein
MGRSKKTPAPPKIKTVAPPAEEVDPAIMAMFLRQQRASKAKSYLTRGQRMDDLAKAKAAAAPRMSGQEAKDVKLRENPLLSDESYQSKSDEEKVNFLAKRSNDVEALKEMSEFRKKIAKLSRKKGRKRSVVSKTLNVLSKSHDRYIKDYLAKAEAQVSKEYKTTQLRNLGIK